MACESSSCGCGSRTWPSVAGACAVFVLFTLVYMLFIVPVREEIFRDFGVALPGLTVGLIRFSRDLRMANPGQHFPLGWLAVGAGVIVGAGLTWASAVVPRSLARALLLVVVLLLLAWMALCAWAMLGPTLAMQESLRQQGI